MTYLSTISDEINSSIIIITETHVSENNLESETSLPGWQQLRADRLHRMKGGVLIYLRDQLTVVSSHTFSNSYVELACSFIPSQDLAIIALYRPPDTPAQKFVEALAVTDKWIDLIIKKRKKIPNIFFARDFNFPVMGQWTVHDMDSSTSKATTRAAKTKDLGNTSDQISKLIDIIHNNAFTQIVNIPTRLENILDLVFVNNTNLVDNIEAIENIVVTDHKLIIAHLNTEVIDPEEESRINFCSTSIPLYNLFKASPGQWKEARNKLEEMKVDQDSSPSKMMTNLISSLDKLVSTCFEKPSPAKSPGSRSNSIIPRHAQTLMRRKINMSRKISKEDDEMKISILRDKIKDIEEELRKSIHAMRAKKERAARSNLITDPDRLHDLVKKINKKSSRIGPLKRNDSTKNIPDVEILSRQYSKVFSTPIQEYIFEDPVVFFSENNDQDTPKHPGKLTELFVTIDTIKEAIDSLPPKAAPGPDGIPNILIKQLKHKLTPILQVIFEKSLDTGEVPEDFLKAFIKPVKKPLKPRSDPAAYHPLSLTLNLAKVLEKVVKKQIEKHLEDNEILSESQHGFRSKRSCLSQLLQHYIKIIKNLEEGKVVDVVYLDYSKAFDTVDRYVLARHMKDAGISDLWLPPRLYATSPLRQHDLCSCPSHLWCPSRHCTWPTAVLTHD